MGDQLCFGPNELAVDSGEMANWHTHSRLHPLRSSRSLRARQTNLLISQAENKEKSLLKNRLKKLVDNKKTTVPSRKYHEDTNKDRFLPGDLSFPFF